jgi:hypothetical protein
MNGGPVYATFTHLDYDPFTYQIQARNNSQQTRSATVRIFMAPRFDEHGDQFRMNVQRLFYYEMDKFTVSLRPGNNTIERSSLDSSVTLKSDASFEILEKLNAEKARDDFRSGEDQSRCGCGWPQHLLLPRGTPAGTEYDLFVMLTDTDKDQIRAPSKPGSSTPAKPQCRDAISFCGILDEKYPDARPMGYPFDRKPYNNPEKKAKMEVKNIEEYVKFIANAATTKVTIIHEPNVVKKGPKTANGMGMVNEQNEVLLSPQCAEGGSSSSSPPTSSSSPPPTAPSSGSNKFPESPRPPQFPAKDSRGNIILQIPPFRGPGNRWEVTQERRQWQAYDRRAREESMEGDWDYLDNNDL